MFTIQHQPPVEAAPAVDVRMTGAVRSALAAVGRTEDIRFSPDGRTLAIAGFEKRLCLLLRYRVEDGPAGPVLNLDDFMELTSPGIRAIHGVEFIDGETLAVANRDGGVALVRIPPGELDGRQCTVPPAHRLKRGRWRGVSTPGSLAALPAAGGGTSLLVCNNYSHRVTRHRLELSGGTIRSWYEGTLRRGIRVPDGIAVSADGQWVAVSSHETSDVKLYATANLGWRARPAGVLEGVRYPHGLRFTADGRHILVADAGAPVVLTYRSDGRWDGPRDPLRVTQVMDDALFERGQALPDGSRTDQEGGPKGLDIDVSQRVVVTTCRVQTLAAFSLESLVSHPG